MKFLLTGGHGRLASALTKVLLAKDHDVYLKGRHHLDVTYMPDVTHAVQSLEPDVIINCAGVLSLDSEKNHRRAWNVNVLGAMNVATMAHVANVHMVHISTDYVFSGREAPYMEGDPPDPINYYGFTKAAGEAAVRGACKQALILRAPFRYDGPWLYKKAFTDQFTSGRWLAEVAPDIVDAAIDQELQGVMHIGGERRSIYELAKEASPDVEPCTRDSWPGLNIPADVSLNSDNWNAWRSS